MKLENESALRARLLDPPKARRLSSQRRLLYARWDLLLFFLRERDFLSYYEGKEERVWDFVYKVTFMGRPLFTKKNSVVVVVVLFLLRV